MGVMPCYRKNCEEILCRILVRGHYICEDCLIEFKEFCGSQVRSESEWKLIFNKFMNTDKKITQTKILTMEEFLDGEY